MKKIICAVMLLLGLSIVSSCEKSEPTADWAQGMWCLTSKEDSYTKEMVDASNKVAWYWELSSNGFFTYYDLRLLPGGNNYYASYSNGVLTKPENTQWVKSMEGKYVIEGLNAKHPWINFTRSA